MATRQRVAGWLVGIGTGLLLGLVVARWLASGASPLGDPVATVPADVASLPPPQQPVPAQAAEPALEPPQLPDLPAFAAPGQQSTDPTPTGLAAVDLEVVRAALPDNLYWQQAAPTQDPRLLDDREREQARRNEVYGKILSGTGSEEEIRAYYDERMHSSSDYVRFVDHILDHYGETLTEQDLELLHVARRLHLARLNEAPRRMQEGFDRKHKQDDAREAWNAEQRAFDAAENPDGEPAPAAEGTDTAAP